MNGLFSAYLNALKHYRGMTTINLITESNLDIEAVYRIERGDIKPSDVLSIQTIGDVLKDHDHLLLKAAYSTRPDDTLIICADLEQLLTIIDMQEVLKRFESRRQLRKQLTEVKKHAVSE